MASEPIARSKSFAVFVPEFECLIAEMVEEWKVPGLAVAVVQNGDVAFASPYGLRDVEAGTWVTWSQVWWPNASAVRPGPISPAFD